MRAQKVHGEPEVRGSGDVGTEYFEIEGSQPAKEMGGGDFKMARWGRGSGFVHELEADRGIELSGVRGTENLSFGAEKLNYGAR